MSRPEAAQHGLSGHTLSPYTKLLLDITNCLNNEELSQLKLALCTDKHVKPYQQASLKNAADILQFMDRMKLISRDDFTLLNDIFKNLGREDLREKIVQYESCQKGNGVLCEENDCNSPDSLPDSQESMHSLTDDEKLERSGLINFMKPSSMLCENEDVYMSSQGSR